MSEPAPLRPTPWPLVLVFSLLAIGIGTAGFSYFARARETVGADKRSELSAIADQKVAEIVRWRSERLADGRVLSSGPFLAAGTREWLRNAEPLLGRDLLDRMTSLQAQEDYTGVLLLDPAGSVRLAVPGRADAAGPHAGAQASEAIAVGQVSLRDIHRGDAPGELCLGLVVPLRPPRARETAPVGYLVLQIDPRQFLYPLIQSWPTPSRTAETLLVRREGGEIVFLNELRHRKGTALSLRFPADKADLPAAMAARGELGVVEGVDYRGEPVLAATRRIPDSPWLLVSKIDREEVYASLFEEARLIALLTGALIALAGLSVHAFWRREQARAQHELLQERGFSDTAIASLPGVFYLLDDEGRFLRWNENLERVSGYSGEEISRMHALDFFAGEDKQTIAERIRETFTKGESAAEAALVGKSGALTPHLFTGRRVRLGDRVCLVGVGIDISARREAEAQLRLQSAALEAADNAIVITDREGSITWANPSFTRLTGFEPGEYEGASLSILKSGRHDRPFYEDLWQTILSGAVWHGDMVNRRKDGTLYTEDLTITPVSCERGEITHFIAVKLDVTERRRAEEALRESEQRYRALAEAAHDDIFIVDRDGRVRYVNAAAAGQLGLAPEQVAGKTLETLFPAAIAARYRASLGQVFASGRHRYVEEPTRYGTREAWIGTWLVPIQSQGGEVEAVMGVSRDLSERVRAEQALRVSEERYRLLFERNLAGVYRTGLDGRVLECNDAFARIFGYASREEIATRPASLLYPRPAAREAFLARLREEGPLVNHESEGRRKDGSSVWTLENASLVEDGESRAVYVEGTLVDVTERKRLEQRLRQAQKMEAIGKLAGGVAHDFNNLLNVIDGHSELALKQAGAEDPLRRHFEEIRQAGERAAALTRQLLAFSRKQIVEPTVLDLNEVVRGMVGMLRRLIQEDIELVTALGTAPALARADRGQVEQVVMNLAVNGRDAMPQGGRLVIETGRADLDEAYCREHVGARPGPHVMLAVSDTGIGMDTETQSHVFEPFFTTKEAGQGTGLGLATVYGIVKQAGGSIWVYSEPGRGATFKVYLPQAEEGVPAARPAVAPSETPRGTETVLLVEDEEALRTLTREVLESLGYTVLEAGHGVEALELSEGREGRIELLVSDVVMPQLSGRELAERLRTTRPEMRVLFISGYTDDAVMRHGLVEARVAFLQKPFTADTLARKLRQVLDAPRAS